MLNAWRSPSLAAGLLAPIGLLAVLAGSAGAQTSLERRALDSFRDSLLSLTDTLVLRSREERLLIQVQRARRDPALHWQLGQLALRQGELGGAAHFDAAAAEFHMAAELAPQWPYAWYGLGLAEYALGSRLGSAADAPGAREAWSRATRAFARASVLEPALAGRLEQLARRALRERAPDRAAVVREALRRATAELRGVRGARLLLALGRVQRETDDTGALASFEAYLATGESRSLAQLELGRTQLLRGELRGMATYLAGAAEEDPPALAEYRADLLPLAGEAELADFDLRRGVARAETLRQFWLSRDRLELRQEGERLAEHLRRLRVARRDFLVVGEADAERLDDRGRVYVRHGEPDDRASYGTPGVEPNESWRYRRGGSDFMLHFVARQTPNDYRLVESVLDVSDVRVQSVPGSEAPRPADAAIALQPLLRSRAPLAPVYGNAGTTRPAELARFLAEERALGRRGIQIATRTDSYVPRYAQELGAWGKYVVAGGTGPLPAVQVLFAIPGYAIEPASGVAGVVYPVRVRFVALDETGALVATVDTVTRLALSDPVPANRSLLGRLEVPVRPGRLVARAAIEYGELAGSALSVDTVLVPAAGSGQLALGSLLLGDPRSRLRVPIGERADVAFSPGGVVRRSEGFELGTELFGLEPGARVELRVLIAPVDTAASLAGATPRWRAFPERAAQSWVTRAPGSGPIVAWRARLPLGKLKPGSWLLAVVATDAAGRTARQETRLLVTTP